MKRTFFLLLIGCLFPGCMPENLMIRQADLYRMERHVQEQNERLDSFLLTQEEILEKLQQGHDEICNASDSADSILKQLQGVGVKQDEQARRQQKLEALICKLHLCSPQEAGKKYTEVQQNSVAMATGGKQVVGAVEKVFISPPGRLLPARIDTGATTASLDTPKIDHFERNGEHWVRFTMIDPEDDSEISLERKVVRNVRITQAVTDETERRPVVELGVTIGKITQTAEFTLSDRQHMEYPVLIGRNILLDLMVVDVSETFIAPPQAPAGSAEAVDAP